jgi:hypothetical protein
VKLTEQEARDRLPHGQYAAVLVNDIIDIVRAEGYAEDKLVEIAVLVTFAIGRGPIRKVGEQWLDPVLHPLECLIEAAEDVINVHGCGVPPGDCNSCRDLRLAIERVDPK